MKAVGIISWKGGTGKTTLASNLNERATAQGLDSILIDMDPQQNAVRHVNFRREHSPDAAALQVFRGGMDLRTIESIKNMARMGRHQLMICDLPGADAFTMDRAVEFMDMLAIPLTSSPYDIGDSIDLIRHCQSKQWPFWVIPFNLPMGNRRTDELVRVMEGLDAPVAPVRVRRRVTYLDASTVGQGVCEYAPDSPAADEMNQLWRWISRQLQMPFQQLQDQEEQYDHPVSEPQESSAVA